MALVPGQKERIKISGYWTESIRWNPDNFTGSALLTFDNGDLVELSDQSLVELGYSTEDMNMIPSTYGTINRRYRTSFTGFDILYPVQIDNEVIALSPGLIYVTVNYVTTDDSDYLDRMSDYINFPVDIVFGLDPTRTRLLHYFKAIGLIEGVGGTPTRPDWARYRLTFGQAYNARRIVPANTPISLMELRFEAVADGKPIVPRPYPVIQQSSRVLDEVEAVITIDDIDDTLEIDDSFIRTSTRDISCTVSGFSLDKDYINLTFELDGEVYRLTNPIQIDKNSFTANITREVEIS